MNSKVEKWIDDNKDEMIETLQTLISFNSVEASPLPGKPFGEEVYNCLDSALSTADNLGFDIKNLDSYCGIVDDGSGEEMLGILCHLDVVPEGDGWDYPPFAAEIHDEKIYGRGAIDNKGPAVAALYALAAVKNSGLTFKRRVRIFLGCNEESGMECIIYYKKHERIPDMSFSPDSSFPLSNSEKSILHVTYKRRYNSRIGMRAGEAANVVPAKCSATVDGKAYSTVGIQAHASLPQEGRNAIQMMFQMLNAMELDPKDKKYISALYRGFRLENHGESLGLDVIDESGRMTINPGVIRWDENGFELTLDLRVPTSMKEKEVSEKLDKLFVEELGCEKIMWSFSQGYSLSDDCELVTKLMKVYQARTGDIDSKPIKMGGGTYARHLPNAVGFGPEGWICEANCHVANEFISIDQLVFNAKIIADAIIALACYE